VQYDGNSFNRCNFFNGPVNAASYTETAEVLLIAQLRNRVTQHVWLQHDGTPAHFTLTMHDILDELFCSDGLAWFTNISQAIILVTTYSWHYHKGQLLSGELCSFRRPKSWKAPDAMPELYGGRLRHSHTNCCTRAASVRLYAVLALNDFLS
jgi:hypothetical protein